MSERDSPCASYGSCFLSQHMRAPWHARGAAKGNGEQRGAHTPLSHALTKTRALSATHPPTHAREEAHNQTRHSAAARSCLHACGSLVFDSLARVAGAQEDAVNSQVGRNGNHDTRKRTIADASPSSRARFAARRLGTNLQLVAIKPDERFTSGCP